MHLSVLKTWHDLSKGNNTLDAVDIHEQVHDDAMLWRVKGAHNHAHQPADRFHDGGKSLTK